VSEETKKEMGDEIQNTIAEKIREESREHARLTRIDSIACLAPGLGHLEFVAMLGDMITDARFADIKLMNLLDAGPGATYLCSDRYIARENLEIMLTKEGIRTAIAARVRENSEKLKLTSVDSLDSIAPSLGRGEAQDNLAAMFDDDRYKDIKLVAATAGSGPVYLCSDRHITRETAEKLLRTEEERARIAEMVREGSRDLARRLTRSFSVRKPDATPKAAAPLSGGNNSGSSVYNVMGSDRVDFDFADMVKDDRYQDIKPAVTARGDAFLYSERYITGNYAEILAGAEGNDPCDTIAALVREGSKVYGQPTSFELFGEPVFSIDPGELETNIAHILGQPKYHDIKQVQSSGGTRFLYSNLHLDEAEAVKLAERSQVKPTRKKSGMKRPAAAKRAGGDDGKTRPPVLKNS